MYNFRKQLKVIKFIAACASIYLVAGTLSANATEMESIGETVIVSQPSDDERPYLLMDIDSGKVLTQQNAFRRWAPASLTKLMTAYVTFRAIELQQIDMNSPVRISEYALSQPPSKMGFPIGTILTVESALKILMVKSANDLAVALSESVAGSEEAFVARMNSHARQLGLSQTRFVNPHGLHDPGQFTNARDMAVLGSALLEQYPQYESFFKIPAVRVGKRRLRNHNALIERFPGATGMKTGYVCASGFNVVATAERGGRRLLAVILGGESGLTRSIQAAKLFEEGFAGLYRGFRISLSKLYQARPISPVPADLTKYVCPRKFSTRPKIEAKKPIAVADASGIADSGSGEKAARPLVRVRKSAKPGYSPDDEAALAGQSGDGSDEPASEDQPPSLKELEAVYLTPRKKVGEDVKIVLGGGTGRNPHGIRHHQGGPAKPVIPIPTPRPAT